MKFLLLIGLLVFMSVVFAQETPDGRRLRVITEEKFPESNLIIGGTTGNWSFGTNTGHILDREFAYVTPENDFKQPQIHPDNTDKFDWSKPDAWLAHIETNNQILRMHSPISPQCSKWAKTDTRTAEELEKNLTDYFTELCKRYNGVERIQYMDVVNETIINGEWFGPREGTDKWENPWPIIGFDTDNNETPLYIKKAFEIAYNYAPSIKLIYNQHEKTIVHQSWQKIKETIEYLRNVGLRVDGIGWQAHLNVGWEKIEGQIEALNELIEWAHKNNLEFHITEMSVYIPDLSDANLQEQAETYGAIINILIEHSQNGKVGWNTWHIDDGHGATLGKFPSIFDENYLAKPAYYTIQQKLENVKKTNAVMKNKKNERRNIYPNPTEGNLIIDDDVNILKVYTTSGRLVKQINVAQNRVVSVDDLLPGMYLVEIFTNNTQPIFEKILVE